MQSITGATRLYGIFGHPITHSLSPLMHALAFQHHGLDCLYVPFAVPPESLALAVAGAVALGVRGFNVTLPHKEAILPLLHEVSVEASFVGAVNTVCVDTGRTTGYNTDGAGFMQPLHSLELSLPNMPVCVLGAGGAARAITMALLQRGCTRLTVTNRTYERSERLVQALQERFSRVSLQAIPWAQAAQIAQQSTLIVNATAVGLHHGQEALLPATCFRANQVVYDIVYRPLYTPLLQTAQRCGATIITGLDMLIGQGAEAFRLWTGLPFPVDAVRQKLHALLQAEGARETRL